MDTRKFLPATPLLPKGICVYCGSPAESNDHFPPSCLLGKELPKVLNRLTLPACLRHNTEFSRHENIVKAVLAGVSFEPDLKRENEPGGRVHRAKERDRKLKAFVESRRQPDNSFRVDAEVWRHFEQVLKKTVLGLFFGHFGQLVAFDQFELLALEHQRGTRNASQAAAAFALGGNWPELTADMRALKRMARMSVPSAGGIPIEARPSPVKWRTIQHGVFRYAFVANDKHRLVCVLDIWKTVVAAVKCPWPGGKGPVGKQYDEKRSLSPS